VPSSSAIGTEIAGYRLEAVLSGTAASTVYLGRAADADAEVSVEVVSGPLTETPDFAGRLERVTREVDSLSNPHIAPVDDVIPTDDGVVVTSRHRDQIDLGLLLDSVGALSLQRVTDLTSQAAMALDAAHDANIVHGSLEPSRLLVAKTDGRDRVLVSGFGMAPEPGEDGVAADLPLPPPAYAAPEQVNGEAPTRASDVYALACIVYAALIGNPPFGDGDRAEVAEGHLNQIPARPGDVAPELPPEVDGALARALAKDPERRTPSAGELAHDLMAAAGRTGGSRGRASGKEHVVSRWENSIAAGMGSWSPSSPVTAIPEPGPPRERDEAETPRTAAWAPQATPAKPRPPAPPGAGRKRGRLAALAVGLVAVVALAIVLLSGGGSDDKSTKKKASTPPPATSQPAKAPEGPPKGRIVSWPARDGYTAVIYVSPSDRAAGLARARRAAALGYDSGVLDSGDHSNLVSGQIVGFAGVYAKRADAQRAAQRLAARGVVAAPYVRFIKRAN
jgi:serine/threonine protein kinase